MKTLFLDLYRDDAIGLVARIRLDDQILEIDVLPNGADTEKAADWGFAQADKFHVVERAFVAAGLHDIQVSKPSSVLLAIADLRTPCPTRPLTYRETV